MKTILEEIEWEIKADAIIPKPAARADFIVKNVWGVRRREDALIYTIPSHKTKPYEKGITKSEWVQAFEHLKDAGHFSRSWFKQLRSAVGWGEFGGKASDGFSRPRNVSTFTPIGV
jgi:hypothetical protein